MNEVLKSANDRSRHIICLQIQQSVDHITKAEVDRSIQHHIHFHRTLKANTELQCHIDHLLSLEPGDSRLPPDIMCTLPTTGAKQTKEQIVGNLP